MENSPTTKKNTSLDWLVRGTLTKLGEMFDQFTGRNWKPSSSLATSELVERLKNLLDRKAKDAGEKGTFVPHNIKLLMQWDKFSTDAESGLKKLENELLVAAVDHINDKRYQTFAPLKIEIKPDYFTEDVKLAADFGQFAEADADETEVQIAAPDLKNIVLSEPEKEEEIKAEPEKIVFAARFTIGEKTRETKLAFTQGARRSVGRTKENDLQIDDASVSKIHAALILNADGNLTVADTGSTNGTFVGGERIAYGKAFALAGGETIKFGTVEVAFARVENAQANLDVQ